jgi:uncharacterized protein (TIGR03118 family)
LLSTDVVLQFNQAVLAAIRNDRPTIGFVTRDLAIVHSAIFDAVNAIDHTAGVFHVQANAPLDASPVAAAATAGLFTASALFPTDTALFQAAFQASLADVPDGQSKTDGLAVGRFVAEQTLIQRVTDGANAFVPYTPGTAPGDWRPTPPAFAPAQTPQWPFVTPFALTSGSQFRPPPPPALDSAAYTAGFNEVKDFGRVDSTVRTPAETAVARFWEAKAGTPQIAGYWNEIAEHAATSQGNTLDENARLFAELNVALADEAIAFFDAKYTYNRWRPVTAIQLADQDGNPDTIADPNWLPLLNTANHPSWVSAHGGISGAASAVLADFFGTDNVSFSLTSEDLKGVTRSFSSFSAAAAEAENSVVWSGTHFRFDVVAGDAQGRAVAGFIDQKFFKPTLANAFLQTNLVSDIPGLAAVTDSQLVNPWGLTVNSNGPFWVSDNQTGLATLYNGQGVKAGLVVAIPSAPGSPFKHATPTGTVFNTDTNPGDFEVTAAGKNGPVTAASIFLFDTLDGTIDGGNGIGTNAIIAVNNPGAVYTGLAIDTSTTAGNTLLYAADWGKGTVEVYNGSFQQVGQGAFQDKDIPKGFRPFNVQDLNGQVFVTYAQFDPTTGADAGTGGFVAQFTRDGVLERTIKGAGHFNSPWGLTVAPDGFGGLGGDLLVGNFGDGHINVFDPHGHFVEELTDAAGKPITIENLWALRFGNAGKAGSANTLFFTAGLTDASATIFGATDGLLGSLQALPPLNPRAPLLPHLPNGLVQTFSAVPTAGPTAGGQNPYGLAFVPSQFKGQGALQPGDLLVSDFNNAGTPANPGGLQGLGSTILRITPQGATSVFFQGPPGLGLTTALGVLQNGDVLVGSVPTTDGTAATIQPGALLVLNANGNLLEKITDSQLLDSPWDLTINDQGATAQVFVSNVVSGTVTRLDLKVPLDGKPRVQSETVIASGFTSQPNGTALIVGPTGLAYDARTGTLYVVATADNTIVAIAHAARRTTDAGTGRDLFAGKSDPHLHGPLGLVLAPNGDLIVANGDAVNPDPTQPSELVEFTPQGAIVGEFSVDPNPGGAFGLAVADDNGQIRFAAVDDNTNTVSVWHFAVVSSHPNGGPHSPIRPARPGHGDGENGRGRAPAPSRARTSGSASTFDDTRLARQVLDAVFAQSGWAGQPAGGANEDHNRERQSPPAASSTSASGGLEGYPASTPVLGNNLRARSASVRVSHRTERPGLDTPW